MSGQSRRTIRLASSLGLFAAIFSRSLTGCLCLEETQKERVFFNGVDPEGKAVREAIAPIGGRAVIECEAGGTPAPLIHWLRNGQRIDQGNALGELVVGEEALSFENTETNRHLTTLQLSATRSRLYVDCAHPSDAGLYVCVAETPTRRIIVDYQLKIEAKKVYRLHARLEPHRPHRRIKDHSVQNDILEKNSCFKQNQDPTPIPARIYMWTLHRVEVEGADVQLYCRPTGSGPVKVTWFDRNGDPITKQDTQYLVEDNGDLMVKSINFADNMGLYRCVAENSLGTDTVETFLYPAAREKKTD